jgi:hypothetical protein
VGGARYRERIQKIDMIPFSPLNGSVPVTKRARGMYTAHFEEKGEDYTIEWSAHKVRSSESEFEMKPEFEIALRELRRKLNEEDNTGENGGPE